MARCPQPRREPLPEGIEAAKRALAHCKRWEVDVPHIASCMAADYQPSRSRTAIPAAGWLPERYRDMTVADLRDELARLPGGAS